MSKRAEEAALKAYPYDYPERVGYRKGYGQAEKDLGWHSVDESLPPIDEEVIVLRNEANGFTLPFPYHLSYGHLVSDKSIFVEYNGWNVPGVRYWMPCPKLPEE